MDLSADRLHQQLDLIADQGWDGPAAAELLGDLRRHVVRPVVRASRLRGPAADQAEATGWAAAWDAIRRPTARTAENPGGMIWGAVRRSVAAEVRQATLVGVPLGDLGQVDASGLSEPGGTRSAPAPKGPEAGPSAGRLGLVVALLVEAGWERRTLEEVIDMVAQRAIAVGPTVAVRRVPAWQVRRVARLVGPGGSPPSLLELVVRHGRAAVEHPAAIWAARSTLSRWQSGPAASLEQLAAVLTSDRAPTRSAITMDSAQRARHVAWTVPESAEPMGDLP